VRTFLEDAGVFFTFGPVTSNADSEGPPLLKSLRRATQRPLSGAFGPPPVVSTSPVPPASSSFGVWPL